MPTRPRGSAFNFADQGVFTSALDIGCLSTNTAAANKALIVTALTAMTSGGVLLIPHGIPHDFIAADFPVTAEFLCVWELTGNSFKLITNQAHTSDLGDLLETIRINVPQAVKLNLVDVLTSPATYTFSIEVYNNAGSPVIAGSSFDVCTFVPGLATPAEAIARSGPKVGRHYFFRGISVDGQVLGSRSIQAPATDASILMDAAIASLILDHAATIATLTVTLPASPQDGNVVNIFSRSIVTALTLAASAGQSIAAGHTLTTLAALQSVSYVYNSSDTSWYRVR